MCFSADASFAAAAVLVPAGVYCTTQAFRKDRRMIPLGLVPLLFAVQQASEGFVWLAMTDGDAARATRPAQVFLFIAMILWPIWNSLCVQFVRASPLVLGTVRLLLLASFGWVWAFGPVFLDAEHYLRLGLSHHSIRYDYSGLPVYRVMPIEMVRVLYTASLCLPWAIVWHNETHIRVLGVLFGVATVVTLLFYSHAFASVWCFFAAAISAYLCALFRSTPPPPGVPDQGPSPNPGR
jgi:hypothetical protein